jgi:hypothetical protein
MISGGIKKNCTIQFWEKKEETSCHFVLDKEESWLQIAFLGIHRKWKTVLLSPGMAKEYQLG